MAGEAGLSSPLHQAGFIRTKRKPDYVVLGETRTYSFEARAGLLTPRETAGDEKDR